MEMLQECLKVSAEQALALRERDAAPVRESRVYRAAGPDSREAKRRRKQAEKRALA